MRRIYITRRKVAVAIVAVLAFGAYYFFGMQRGGETPPDGMPVSASVVIEREVQPWSEFSGRLEAVDSVDIRPRVSGTIDSVHFTEGVTVKKGKLLFIIDPRPYAAEVAQAEGDLKSFNATMTQSKLDYDRAKGLIKQNFITRREFDARKNAYLAADASLQSARAALKAAKLNLEYTRIQAPITGRIGRAEITVGNLVDAGSNAPVLTRIVSMSPIYADFEIDEQTYITFLKVAANKPENVAKIPVQMGLADQEETPYSGKIQSFDNQLDPATGTLRVRAVFDNKDGALVPGLFARIRIGSAEKQKAALIADRAVGTDQSKKFVYVVAPDNMVAYREITLGPSVEGLRMVQSGLEPGETIVVNGLQRVHPGMQVTPQLVPMDAPPEASDNVAP